MSKILAVICALLATILLASCGGGGDDDNTPGARLRVLHASPDAPAVDVYVDGTKVLSDVTYPTVSSYLNVRAGSHVIKVNAAGTSTTVINVNPSLAAGGAYTAIAANFLANIQALLATDETTAPPAGQARVRVIHAAPDAGPVDVLVNGQAVLTNVPFGAISNYLTLPAGTYDVKVNAAGTSTTAIEATLTVAAGTNYSAVAIGSIKTAQTNPLAIKVLTDG
ncbi:DUF4397 domain-containing protein [Paraburkholderia sp. J76]|uniref:DUF4397 domain-containing protein n=1 Tax=Paraburkholderia sp. J76 TaxID=2805439 RepID=UPI002ABE1BD2|nr:DUF4397 domain-containing protein [Paraburkholderia sp. J76]